ncbi:MAG: hypothetical protein HQK73_12550, partial [Desulfamplus sp.]|nr:hypothetical protein [Desulfamplus sp.]
MNKVFTRLIALSFMAVSLFTGVLAQKANAADSAKPYRIGIVTPTLSASEDEFRGAVRVSEKY